MTNVARTSRARAARGFTLLELILVVAVLSVLVALSITVGSLVVRGGSERATQSMLTTLDRALDEYIALNGAAPPYIPDAYDDVVNLDLELTEYQGIEQPRRPDATVFIESVSGSGEAREIIDGLPERFRYARATNTGLNNSATPLVSAPSIIDAWSEGVWKPPFDPVDERIVLYVHPENSLAQDLFGNCKNDRPYFLSAGADGLYGLNDDPFIPPARDGTGDASGSHTYQTVLRAQEDTRTSYPIATLTERAFNRTDSAGVR